MSLDRILCLANSYKHDHRCVAGINIATKKWVRLIGRQIPGCLTRKEASYPDGRDVALLDIFEVELGERCNSKYHPEDVYVTEKPWQPVLRFEQPQAARFLADYANKGPAVLQGYGDRVYGRKIEGMPVEKSLELIHPENLWWWIREEPGKRKNRAIFRAGNVIRTCYDLAVTDPAWLDQLHLLPAGIYPHAFFFKDKLPRTFLTVSLSEPFEGFHYKLVAGVINILA
jgi:hypothetical protein